MTVITVSAKFLTLHFDTLPFQPRENASFAHEDRSERK